MPNLGTISHTADGQMSIKTKLELLQHSVSSICTRIFAAPLYSPPGPGHHGSESRPLPYITIAHLLACIDAFESANGTEESRRGWTLKDIRCEHMDQPNADLRMDLSRLRTGPLRLRPVWSKKPKRK